VGGLVNRRRQMPLRKRFRMREEKRAGKKRKKSFRRGGKGRDDGSPKVRVDIVNVVDKGYQVVLSACW